MDLWLSCHQVQVHTTLECECVCACMYVLQALPAMPLFLSPVMRVSESTKKHK